MRENQSKAGTPVPAGISSIPGGSKGSPMEIILAVLAAVGGLLIGFFVTRKLDQQRGQDAATAAEQKSRSILEDAQKKAQEEIDQAQKRAKEIREKESQLRKNTEKELNKKKTDLEKLEEQLITKIDNLEKKSDILDKKSDALEKKQDAVREKEDKIDHMRQDVQKIIDQQKRELERVAALSADQARDILLKRIEDELQYEIAVKVKDAENRIKETADKKSREVLATAIQRAATDHSIDPIVTVVELPSEEMKGRIIGREGRNIRTFEGLTGVDVIIDDTPQAVVLSGFDSVKREIARVTMEMLTLDGRIHPAKIEEMYEKAKKEVDLRIKEAGEQAMLALGIQAIAPELVEIVGRLNFRTSYGQNVLQHSMEVANLAASLAAEIGANIQLAKRSGLLHDIGKVIDSEEGNHAQLGMDYARKHGESPKVVNAIGAHHEDVPFDTVEAVLIAAADAVSASRRGARHESLDAYIKRLEDLENICKGFQGVSSAYAIQAGREIRVIVNPEQVDDLVAPKMCRDIAKKIESDMEYPGQVKVVVIREVRSTEIAH